MQPGGLELLQRYPGAGQIFAVIFLVSAILTGGLFFLARRQALLPQIRDRDVHVVRKPRVGGVAMWLAVAFGLLWVATDPGRYTTLSFGHATVAGLDVSLWAIFAGMGVILLFGLLDDLTDLKWYWQLTGQALAVLALVIGGVGVEYIRLPFGVQVPLDGVALPFSGLFGQPLYLFSALFTVVWIMAMINAMNFFDGLDGLAGSVAMTAAAALFLVSLKVGIISSASLSLIICGAAAGFLLWNWYPSKLFMGTVGSQLLGFLLGTAAIVSGGKVATALLVLGIPLLDALIVVARRLAAGVSPLHGDQRHLHHRLLRIGLPVPWVVVLVNLISIAFGLAALYTQESNQKGLLTLALIACMALLIWVTYLLEQRANKAVH